MRLKRWVLERWAVAALTLVMVAGLLLGLVEGSWLATPDVLWIAGLSAVALGMALSWLVRRTGLFVGLALVTGLLFTVQYHSQALPEPVPALRELAAEVRWISGEASRQIQRLNVPGVRTSPAPSPPLPEWQAAWNRLSLYAWNLRPGWPPRVDGLQLKMNPVLLASLLGALVWVIAALASWAVARRRSVWIAMAPLLALLAASAYFTAKGWPYLMMSLSAGLLLTCDFSQKRLLSRWRADDLPFGLDLDWWVWASAIAGAAVLAMLFAIRLTDPETRRWLDDTFFPKQPAVASQGGTRTRTGGPELGVMPTEHLLGSGPELSKQTAMQVQTPGVAPAAFYWRATAYDTYTGHGSIQDGTAKGSVDGGRLWPDTAEPPRHFALLRQTYRLESTTIQIYAAGHPVRLNQPARGVWLSPQAVDLLTVQTLTMQSGYEVLSWVPISTADELRGASTDYPDWVKARYLALPDELPGRVSALASKITAGSATPYDRALAIQGYLRTYAYTLDLAAPPTNRDVADYFLFDLKRGYCDYFATAMVVMARSVGLPARLAVGFATGQYDPNTDSYRVSMAEAHAWPEVYFPDYGWIVFEPTTGFALPTRGPTADWVGGAEQAREKNIQSFPASASSPAIAGPGWVLAAVAGGAVLVVIGVVSAGAYRRRKRSRGTPQQVIDGLYRDLLAGGHRLGVPLSEAQTPDEFLKALLSEVAARARRAPAWTGSWEPRLAQVSREARTLVRLYADMVYSPRPPAQPSASAALDGWPSLSRGLWSFWLIGLLSFFRRE